MKEVLLRALSRLERMSSSERKHHLANGLFGAGLILFGLALWNIVEIAFGEHTGGLNGEEILCVLFLSNTSLIYSWLFKMMGDKQ